MSSLIIQKLNFNTVGDSRGSLTSIENSASIPFEMKRIFYIHDVPNGEDRGGHAHRYTNQVLIACHGSVDIICSDGVNEVSVTLNDPAQGILVPEMTWTQLKNFKGGAVCLVLADTPYVMAHSIREWSAYLNERNLPNTKPDIFNGEK